MEKYKILEKEIELQEMILEEKDNQWNWSDNTKTYNDYKNFTKFEREKLNKLNREYRLIKPYTLSELPDYGEIMSLYDFTKYCKEGLFINYDGYGRYVKDGKETDIEIYPSDVRHNSLRTEFDTIIWFNR